MAFVKGIIGLRHLSYQKVKAGIVKFAKLFWQVCSFLLLLVLYFSYQACLRGRVWGILTKIFGTDAQRNTLGFLFRCIDKLDPRIDGKIRKMDLIRISLRNMKVKKTRTYITIGGITVGIATIVFFVSIGYGLQKMVISQVVRLDELKQADVSSQVGSKVQINDKSLSEFSHIPNVTEVLPLISVVGQVDYNGSVSDMAVYGVTSEYLKQSAIKPIYGTIFQSNKIANILPAETTTGAHQAVAGASTQMITQHTGDSIQDVQYSITPGEWIRVRSGPSTSDPILGYTKRAAGIQTGTEVWGSNYETASQSAAVLHSVTSVGGKILGRWIKSPVFLWKKTSCDPATQGDCEPGVHYMVMRDADNVQVEQTGYFAELNMTLTGTSVSQQQVLGTSTSTIGTAPIKSDGSMEFVKIASLSAKPKTPEVKSVTLSQKAVKQPVVNPSMFKVLAIDEKKAIGQVFTVSFVVSGELLPNPNQKLQSEPSQYTIVGVIPGTQTPQFYVPFIDLRSLGVTNYSQAKVVVNNADNLYQVRREIEAKGFTTLSVADTVAQINSVFSFARTILALIGFVALAVASLGMFNTLTVSLLERTREVGLLKTMGMKSEEVKELFLTESMIMSVLGGVFGILAGVFIGQGLSIILSVFTITRGLGLVDVSFVPMSFVIVIIFLSLFVGLITGFYPARRATKISALNALRYE